MGLRSAGALALTLGGVLSAATTQLSPPGASAAVQPCSNGLIAATFDDGPKVTRTLAFVDVLRAKKVPATFFVVGERVDANPAIVRETYNAGFQIGNHSYLHQDLTTLSDSEIVDSMKATQRAIANSGAVPSTLMRPPFGAINSRVSTAVRGTGLVPVLWNSGAAESGKTATQIVNELLEDLRPGSSNISLMHDGWANESLVALPVFIDKARARGYCFAKLGSAGQVLAPVPTANVFNDWTYERNPGQTSYLRFVVKLSEPTSRATSVRVRTVAGTARANVDYVPKDFRLGFPIGVTRKVVRVAVISDFRREGAEQLTLRLSGPSGLRIGDGIAVGTIRNDD